MTSNVGNPTGYLPVFHRKVHLRPCPGSRTPPFEPAAVLKGQFICTACWKLRALKVDGTIVVHGWTVDYIWR